MTDTPATLDLTPEIALDARAVPRIAYRGLWDKFAAPGTPGAVRRSYLRGVSSLVCPGADLTLADATALLTDPAVNRFHQPIYFLMSHLVPIDVQDGTLAPVFVVIPGGPAGSPWPMWRWHGNDWMTAGCYVPVGAVLDLSSPDLSSFRSATPCHVLFESTNVIPRLVEQMAAAGSDDMTLASIRRAWASDSGPHTLGRIGISRITDLVEVEQLDQRIREAA